MDKAQFIRIIQEHRKLIFKVCYTYCPHTEERRDLEQEILAQLWTSIDRFDGRVKISTWLYRVAFNTAIGFLRKDQKRVLRQPLNEAILSMGEEAGNDERLDLLQQQMSNLESHDKALLLYLEGKRHREIAEVLGISESNVGTKLSRIKARLKEAVAKHLKRS